MIFTIVKDKQRYPGLAKEYPDRITITATEEQAVWFALVLSENFSGCDFIFYVEGLDN